MDVKIKQGNEMLDATIEMVEGVMVVSPKEVKWKPDMYDPYYSPFYDTCKFIPMGTNWNGRNKDNIRYNKGLCFKTEEECQEFCNRLNQAIEGIIP